MLTDELQEHLKSVQDDIDIIRDFFHKSQIEERYQSLSQETMQEDFWKRSDQAKRMQDLQRLKETRDEYYTLIQSHEQLPELISLFRDDEQELNKLRSDVAEHCRRVRQFKIQLLLDEEADDKNCFLNINAGAGGTESQDWSEMLLRMYLRFCEDAHLKAQVIDHIPGEEAGIKSAVISVKGTKAFGLLKGEQGIHRLVRISPFDTGGRRHTSFAGVYITPEAEEVEVNIDPRDIRLDTFRASGAGGQHVNTTDSAVRLTHAPSGIVVQSQSERSQHKNRETAMRVLRSRLYQQYKEEEEAKRTTGEKHSIEWGSQIRSYVLQPYQMIKDHRTHYETPRTQDVLNGDIMQFIETYLIQRKISHTT